MGTNDLRLTTISNIFLGDPMFRRTHAGSEMVDQVFRLVNSNWEKKCFAIYPRESLGMMLMQLVHGGEFDL